MKEYSIGKCDNCSCDMLVSHPVGENTFCSRCYELYTNNKIGFIIDFLREQIKKQNQQIQDLQEQLKNAIPKFKNKQFIYALFTNTDFFKGQIESYDYYTKSYLIFFDDNIGSEWIPESLCFKTKSEAERRLKQLQGESR